jgi:hypothetical protein
MYRACSTWQYEVVGHLIERYLQGTRLGYVTGGSYASMPATGVPGRGRESNSDWRVLKSHEGHRYFARALRSGSALAVYAYRDLREVVLSLRHKRATTFEVLLRQGMIHQLLASDRFWRAQPNVLVQRYEELVADPVTGVVQLARHLGLGVTRRQGADIADEYSLQANQTRIDLLRERLLAAGFDLDDPSNQQICDPVTLLHWNHLRPARNRSWRSETTPTQRAQLARICDDWLEANGYDPEWIHGEPLRVARSSVATAVALELDLALGRCAAILRTAALAFPRSSRWVKGLIGLTPEAPRRPFAWPPADEGTGKPSRPTTRPNLDPGRVHFALDHLLRG